MEQPAGVDRFLIKRMNIELLVELRESGLVKIEPFRCLPDDLRLWTVVANTQTLLAQAQLGTNPGKAKLPVLVSLFQRNGWGRGSRRVTGT